MNSCEKYIEAMNRYLDGDLPVSQISDLLEHLEVCPSCRARFEALKILSFEMRHMQKEPPEALHKNIMQAVNSTPRRPKRYAKAVATAAACAALLFIALQGDVFRFAGQSLFTSQSSQSETPYLGQQAADEAASQDVGTAAKAQTAPQPAESDSAALGRAAQVQEHAAASEAPQESAGGGDTAEPAQGGAAQAGQGNTGSSAASSGSTDAAAPSGEETQTDGSDAYGNAVGGAGQSGSTTQPPEEAEDAAQPELRDTETDAVGSQQTEVGNSAAVYDTENFQMPPLDTSEVFAFYCVALGDGALPQAFPEEGVLHFAEKKCTYIYVKADQFTQQGCANLLQQAGFTVVRDPSGLPATDPEAAYGLVVLYAE